MIKRSIVMEELLDVLDDGDERTVEMLAYETNSTRIDIKKQLEFLERMGVTRNMGEMWKVV